MSHGIIARTQPRWPTSKPNAMHHVAVMPAIQVPSLLVLAQGLNLIDSSLSLGFSLHLSPLMSLFFVPSWLCQVLVVTRRLFVVVRGLLSSCGARA